MAMLHHHERNTANITGRSINEASLHRSVFLEVFFFFLIVLCLWATNKTTAPSHAARRALRLTLLRPEPSCGGRDLEAAVTRALDVARFPVGTRETVKSGLVFINYEGFFSHVTWSDRVLTLATQPQANSLTVLINSPPNLVSNATFLRLILTFD